MGWFGQREIGEAFDSGLGALKEHTIDLSKTDLGKYTMILIAWKVIGRDLLQIIFGIPFTITWICVVIWAMRRSLFKRKVVSKRSSWGMPLEYEIIEPPSYDYSDYPGWCIGGASIVFTIISCLILFL